MSAQLAQANSFSAHLALAAGVAVSITADTMDKLAGVVTKLQGGAPANEAKAAETKPAKETKPAAQETPAGNAPASTSTPASAQPAAAGSAPAPAADAPRFTYEDIKARVLSLAKVSRDTATAALKKFGVDNANKLKLENYSDFIAHADELLGAKGA